MTEILIQSSLAASKNKKLLDEAARIRQTCLAQHGEKPLVECPECFEKVLETARSRFLTSPDNEWFTTRRGFLQDLDAMLSDAKEYRLDPGAIDRRIQEERSRWYAENVRASLLRLMVEDPSGREAVFEKLEDPPSDVAGLARDIAEILSHGLNPEVDVTDVPDRLASAPDSEGRLKVIKEAFFSRAGSSGNGETDIPSSHQKYFDMLKQHNLSMEQIVDRILEERQAAVGAREQTVKLKSRLDDLKRARAAHELQKTRKAKDRASSIEKTVPDELYKLPPCAVCGEVPSTKDFLCCPICAIFVGREVQEQHTVYCTPECKDKGHQSHIETHGCSSGEHCVQLQDEDTVMENTGNTDTSKTVFCSECLSSLKLPTLFCSLACADRSFQQHREKVHLPTRAKLGLVINDEDQLSRDPSQNTSAGESSEGGEKAPGLPAATKYRAKDIAALIIPFQTAVEGWEEQNTVHLEI